jgi:hypothetical protein
LTFVDWGICEMASTLAFCIPNVMTLALSLRPMQGHGKVRAENATQEYIHTCERVKECEGLNSHTP